MSARIEAWRTSQAGNSPRASVPARSGRFGARRHVITAAATTSAAASEVSEKPEPSERNTRASFCGK